MAIMAVSFNLVVQFDRFRQSIDRHETMPIGRTSPLRLKVIGRPDARSQLITNK